MCREEAWGDFEEKIAEGWVLRTSVKKSTRGCGSRDGAGFQCGEEQAALESLRRGREFHCRRIKCGARQGLVIKEERRDRGRVQRDGAGALRGDKRQGLKFARQETKQGLESRGAKGCNLGRCGAKAPLGALRRGECGGGRCGERAVLNAGRRGCGCRVLGLGRLHRRGRRLGVSMEAERWAGQRVAPEVLVAGCHLF